MIYNLILFLFLIISCTPQPVEEQVSIEEGSAGILSLSSNESSNFGIVAIGGTKSHLIRVINTGKLDISEINFSLNGSTNMLYTGDSFPGLNGTCPSEATLKPGDTCFIEVFVFSNFAAIINENLSATYKDGIGPNNSSYSVRAQFGNPGVLTPNVTAVDFGNIQIGDNATATVTITNTGNLGLEEIQGFVVTADGDAGNFSFTGDAYPGTNGSCGSTLAVGQSCTVEVRTDPTILEFAHTGSIEFSYKNPSQYQGASVNLTTYGADVKGYLNAEVLGGGFPIWTTALNNGPDADLPIVTFNLTNTGYLATSAIDFKSSADLPLVVADNRCPTSLAPEQGCQIDLKLKPQYSYPLPEGVEFLYALAEQEIIFEYNNSKDAALQDTNSLLGGGSVIGEGNLLLYPNKSLPDGFDSDITIVDKTATWNVSDWEVIVGTGNEQRTLLLKNGAIGKNVSITDLNFTLTPSTGPMRVSCIANNNCPSLIQAGLEYDLVLTYTPTVAEDRSSDPYLLKIDYNDGTKMKSFTVEVPTIATALPYISVVNGSYDEGNDRYDVNRSVMLNDTVSGTITIKNSGVSGINIAQTATIPTGQAGAEFYTLDNSDCDREIKDGETCDLRFSFSKAGDPRAKPFNAENFVHYFSVNNGQPLGDPTYQAIVVDYNVNIYERGWYDVPEQDIDFGQVLYSTDDVGPLGQVNSYTRTFSIDISEVMGSNTREHFNFEITGDEASHFSLENTAGSILKVGGVDNGAANAKRQITVRYTAPQQSVDLGADDISTATLTISYHGLNQDAASTDFEPEIIVVNLIADPIAVPKYSITNVIGREPFSPVLYDPEAVSQLTATVANAAHTIFEVTNRGLTATYSTNIPVIRAMKPKEGMATVIDDHYKIRAVDQNDPCFASYNLNTYQQIEFSINPMMTCQFEVYDYEGDGFGRRAELLQILWANAQGSFYDEEGFTGITFRYANLGFVPSKSGSLNFVKFSDLELVESETKDFVVDSLAPDRYTHPGVIVDVVRVDDPTGIPECNTTLNLPPVWSGAEVVYSASSHTLSENNCDGTTIHNGEGDTPPYYFSGYQSDCGLKITFQPQRIGKVERACFMVTYKKTQSATAPTEIAYVNVGGMGKVPKSIFNGWRDIFAEGETADNPAMAKVSWNAMTVQDNLGTVVGYRVYRKAITEGTFPDEYLSLGSNADYFNSSKNYYELSNDTNEVLPAETTLQAFQAGKVYSYKIQAVINVPGEGEFLSETASSTIASDFTVTLVVPKPYHSLVHRWTANMYGCMNHLGKDYSDLNRLKDYSCDFTGEGNENGAFDVVSHTIVEKYETGKRTSDGQPDHTPNLAPYLFESLSQAQDYCDSKTYSIDDLNIYNHKKELISRRDYMIASIGIDPSTCIGGGGAMFTGEERCRSSFGVNDLIGNAWDLVNEELLPLSTSTWRYQEGSLYEDQDLYFSPGVLDLETYNGADYSTFMDFYKYDGTVECFNALYNESRYSLGGICAEAKGEKATTPLYSDIMSDFAADKVAMIFPKHEGDLGGAFTIKRFLMLGGSSSSTARFGVQPHNRVSYWTNPETERVLMAQHPNGQYEGGAPRCTFKFDFN